MPVSEPVASKTNVSSLPAAPVRSSNPLNESGPMLPVPGPVIDQTVSTAGPSSRSFPVPAIKLTANGIGVVIANVSSPSVPWIVMPAAPASECRETTPSMTSTSSSPSTAIEIMLPSGGPRAAPGSDEESITMSGAAPITLDAPSDPTVAAAVVSVAAGPSAAVAPPGAAAAEGAGASESGASSGAGAAS